MSQLFAEFGVPAGEPPPLLPGADRRDKPYVAQAAAPSTQARAAVAATRDGLGNPPAIP